MDKPSENPDVTSPSRGVRKPLLKLHDDITAPLSDAAKSFEERSHSANTEGRKIDLDGCYYGRHKRTNAFFTEPADYYYYLSGLVRVFGATRVLELGTNFGGSIKSMIRGLPSAQARDAQFVTVDKTTCNLEGFERFPDTLVKRVTGDVFESRTVEKVARIFGDDPIDLLFVDTIHNYAATGRQINLYANRFQPRLLVLDDIRLNASMRELWRDLVSLLPQRCLDVSDLVNREAGFGTILFRG